MTPALVGVLANKMLLTPGHTVMRLLSATTPTVAGKVKMIFLCLGIFVTLKNYLPDTMVNGCAEIATISLGRCYMV